MFSRTCSRGFGNFLFVAAVAVELLASHARVVGQAESDRPKWLSPRFVERAEEAYETAKRRYDEDPENLEAAWRFGKASFEWAEFSETSAHRESVARPAIRACRHAIEFSPDSAPGHYYLAMNLGQLARTKLLGALRLVDEMETEFLRAIELDPAFENAGPDRNLGWLYLQAPGWPASIGSKSKARRHIEKSVELAPNFPANRLNLLAAYLEWGEKDNVREAFRGVKQVLPKARKEFSGESWERKWVEWDEDWQRLQRETQRLLPDLSDP